MAFKIWQIGLHLQQQEAVAVAIVRGAKGLAVRDDGPRAGYGSGLPALRLQRRLTQSRL